MSSTAMAPLVHPTAVVDAKARLGERVSIGPYAVIGPEVQIGDDCQIGPHVVIDGHTTIGAGVRIFSFASLGTEPQDLKYSGEHVELVIGKNCLIREGVTLNPGTGGGGGVTRIGDDCVFLTNAHVAHDCTIGNHVIFSNNVMLAGHCHVGDFVIIGGGAGIHQFVRIGAHAFLGGLSGVENDVIPYGMALGNRAHLAGLNIVGMKRRGLERENIHALRRAYRLLFADEGTLKERMDDMAAEFGDHPVVNEILDFVRAGGDRSICTPRDTKAG